MIREIRLKTMAKQIKFRDLSPLTINKLKKVSHVNYKTPLFS